MEPSGANIKNKIWQIFTTRRFERSLMKLDKKTIARIFQEVKSLSENPFAGKKLTGVLKDKRSLRVGGYRVIYKLDKKEKVVYLLDVRHRKVAYRRP